MPLAGVEISMMANMNGLPLDPRVDVPGRIIPSILRDPLKWQGRVSKVPGVDEELSEDLERRMSAALRDAVAEAEAKGLPDIANALDELRTSTAQWRQNAVVRLKALGIYSMTPEQYELWIDMMSKALAERAVMEAKALSHQRQSEWWRNWQVRLAVAISLISIITVAVGQLYGLFSGKR